jgi:indoleamine 2,3-dioxygenase
MLPPIPILEDYGISPHHGFLPPDTPLAVLPDPHYDRWEAIISNLQSLLLSRRLRRTIEKLPVLSTGFLQTDSEWRRAYVVLVFILHAYVWGGEKPAEVGGASPAADLPE